MEKTEFIKFNNVCFSYRIDNEDGTVSRHEVLKDFNLSINDGDFVAVLGHNGSGKSTIAKLTNGILFPNKGFIEVNGIKTVNDESIFDVRRNVGMVFQDPDNQIVSSVVEEDVAFGVENLGYTSEECRLRVDKALEQVGMQDYKLASTTKLSGGQKQRVAIAGIIAMQPKCIVLDEPTAMLDPIGRKDVLKIMKQLNSDYGITIVLITHNMDEAVQANRVIVMDGGNIVLDDIPEEVFKNYELLKSIGLDVPQSTDLSYQLGFEKVVLNPEQCAQLIYSQLT